MEVLYRLKGNEPLLLDDPDKVWILHSGNIALFATKVKEGIPEGNRRYLFSLSPASALFGAALLPSDLPAQQSGLLAVALEPTELSQISIADLVVKVKKEDAEALALIEAWVNHFHQILGAEYTAVNSSRYLLLREPENAAELPNILADVHIEFFNYLNDLEQQETLSAYRQFQQREQLNSFVVESALSSLASVIEPQQETPRFEQATPLLVAAGAVARVMGITITAPAELAELENNRNPVEVLARSSQFRTRIVRLEENWWRNDCGPLLGYTQDEHPVALLPAGKGYIVLDGVTRSRTVVNAQVAATLKLQAYQFYRPLPEISHPVELFQFGSRGYVKDIASVLAVGIIGSVLGMVVPQATALLVDQAIPDSDRSLLWQIGLALLAIALGRSAFELSQGIIALRVESGADSGLQTAIWDRLLRLSPAFFRDYSSGDLVSRALAVRQIRAKVSGVTLRTLFSGLFALLNLVLMFVYSWQLALVGVGIALVASAITVISGLLLVRWLRRMQQLDGEINGLTVQLINGVAKLRVAQAESRAFAAWAERYSEKVKLEARLQRITDAVSVFNEVLSMVSAALLYSCAMLLIQTSEPTGGGLTTGTFLAFSYALGIFIGGVTTLSNTLTDILAIVPLWERAEPILRSLPEYDANKVNPGTLKGRVALEDVTFGYQEDAPPVLNRISLHAEPGEFVAIVGPSGSGKSTLFRLLLGFETPASGRVYYDNLDLQQLDLVAVRRQLGVVLQNGRIGTGSIFENITAGANLSHEEAWKAAQMAGLAEDIQQFPMGMHTVISEGGTNLSGGQRQRLLIARALVNQPKIILMDEATSALDNRTQMIVTESLDQLQVTRIVIAHRLSTIRNADRIYVVESGRVVQVGKFEELVNYEGLFAQLVARQME